MAAITYTIYVINYESSRVRCVSINLQKRFAKAIVKIAFMRALRPMRFSIDTIRDEIKYTNEACVTPANHAIISSFVYYSYKR